MFDLVKFATLAFRIRTLATRLHDNPPDSLDEYTTLAAELQGLIDELVTQRKSPDFDSDALKAGRAKASAGFAASDADLDHLSPGPQPPTPPPPTGILTSDPGMQKFPADVYVTSTTPLKYLIHSGRVGDPVPNTFSPELPGVDEPGWHILHDSQRP